MLTLAIACQGVAFPTMVALLDKRSNSHTNERIEMVDRYIRLFGEHTTDGLLADRKFVGQRWIKYLNGNHIRYYIRIRENLYALNSRSNSRVKACWLFSDAANHHCVQPT